MQVPIDQITDVPKRLDYAEIVGPLNDRLAQGRSGLQIRDGLAVGATCYRAGRDVVVDGVAEGTVSAVCGRCLDEYPVAVTVPFRVILVPKGEGSDAGEEVECEDLGRGVLDGDMVDVTAIVHEHLLLAMPTARVCRPTCRGLCPTCGTNLNEATCACSRRGAPPRLAVLHDLLRARDVHD